MKITNDQLKEMIERELDGIDKKFLEEGFFDAFKGGAQAAGGMAKDAAVKAATAAKNKVAQVAGDVVSAGRKASLKADFEKASQKIALQVQQSIATFTELLTRASRRGHEEEEQQIKAELQALKTYQSTSTPPDVKMSPVKPSPTPVDLPPMAAKTPAKLYSNSSERRVKSKLDKENIIKVVNKYGGPDNAAAIAIASKKLGISGNAIIQALKR